MPVTVLVATGDTHTAHFVQPGRACIVTDDGKAHEVSNDHARALLLAIEAGAGMYISPEGVAGVDVSPVDQEVDLDAARAELMRAQAAKAMAEASAIFRGERLGADTVASAGTVPAFPLSAEQIVTLLGETIRVVLDETSRPQIQRYGVPLSITERLLRAAGLQPPPPIPPHLRRSGNEPSRRQASEEGGEGYA